MKKLNLNVIALAVGLALGAPSMAAELSAAEYAAAEKKIAADYTSAKAACSSLAGIDSEICIVEANGKNEIAKADLEAQNEPSAETRFEAQIARADAAYAVAKERCDSTTETVNTNCLESAKTADATARAKADKELKLDSATSQVEPQETATPSDNGMRGTETLFDFDSADLRAAGRATLDDFVDQSNENSSAQISVIGYTDRLGADAYNQQLSEQRMEAVKDYLVSEGIEANRISAEGKGHAEPNMSADECPGERSAAVIACLQPDRRVVASMTEVVSSN